MFGGRAARWGGYSAPLGLLAGMEETQINVVGTLAAPV